VQNVENIYETTTGGSTDLRYLTLWNQYNYAWFPTKYNQDFAVTPNAIPLIRLPEMYYIAAECGGPSEGLSFLNAVRESRALHDLPPGMDDLTFQNEIFKEYQKEFYCEGQLFYYYKRLNMPYMLEYDNVTQIPTGGGVYVLPLPASEIFYGGR
jgi:hypothetical protein